MSVLLAVGGWCTAAMLLLELRRRSALLADAAHELRRPVTALSLGLEWLRRQPVARRRAEALLTELGRMQAAADDVAAAARGRRAAGRPESLVLRELLERSSEAWLPAAERRGGSVVLEWEADAARVRADPRRLAQAFGNLLANAVEHGGGEVVVRGRRSPGGVRVEVADSGDGRSAPAGADVNRASGRGRGLVIARRALRRAGGRLDSRDLPGRGRVAVAELPLDRVR